MNTVVNKKRDRKNKFLSYFDQWNADSRILFLAVLVGLVGGFGAVVFRGMIDFCHYILYSLPKHYFPQASALITVSVATLGGLIVGAIVYYYSSEAKGHGVPEIISAVNLNHGRMRLRVPFIKMLASAITIGTNGSAGREGPIAQIGGGFGSVISKVFELDTEDTKTLVIAGVSAGIAATFNAPMGGILFGLEIIRRDKRSVNILPLIVASVVGTAVSDYFINDPFRFEFPQSISYESLLDVPIFVIFGIIIGLVSILWTVGFYFIEDFFERLRIHPVLVTGLGGFLVGLTLLWFPGVSGVTYTPINEAFFREASWIAVGALLLLALMKMLATSFTLGSGGSGGIFAPTLFIGAMLGSAFGMILQLLGLTNLPIALFAVLGMAATFSGSSRAPLTGVIIISEMIGDFLIFIPLLFTVATAWLVSRTFYPYDIYMVKLRRRGLEFGFQGDLLENLLVRDIMAQEIITVSPKDRIEHVIELMKDTGHTGYPVVEGDLLFGIITEHDVDHALDKEDIREWIVSEHCEKNVVSVVENCPVSTAFLKMAELGINRFPVIDSKSSHQLVGWITRSDVMRAYRVHKKIRAQEKYEEQLFDNMKQKKMEKKIDN